MRFYIGRPVILGAMSISLFLAPVPHAQAEPAPSPVAAGQFRDVLSPGSISWWMLTLRA